MKLAFLFPQVRKLTGAERLILKLAEYVAREGHQVDVITHYFAPDCRPCVAPGVTVKETGARLKLFNNHYWDAALEYAAGPLLLRLVDKDTQAICFFGPPSLPALWAAKAFRMTDATCAYFCYEPPRFAYSDTAEVSSRMGMAGRVLRPTFAAYRTVDRRFVRLADTVLSNSPFGASLIKKAYGREAPVIVHGADLKPATPEEASSLRQYLGIGPNDPVAITVNHLHPRKRIDLFIRSISHVAKDHPNARGIVVGKGPEEPSLRALTEELDLKSNMIFAGFVPEQELPAYYAASNVYVHTGKLESFGLSVIEGEAAGLPAVAVAEGGPTETVLDGKTGFLVQADAGQIGEKLAWLFANPEDAAAMGKAASDYICAVYRWELGARTLLANCSHVNP